MRSGDAQVKTGGYSHNLLSSSVISKTGEAGYLVPRIYQCHQQLEKEKSMLEMKDLNGYARECSLYARHIILKPATL